EHACLDIDRHAGGHPVHVNLIRVQALRFKEQLVSRLVWKLYDLVFDGWTISRANAFNLATVERRTCDAISKYRMGLFCCVGDVTGNLLTYYFCSEKRKGRGFSIAMLRFEARPVDGAAIQPRRGPSLETLPLQPESSELIAQQ